MSWRYIAQRALTGEFLDFDVPLQREELQWSLSGAGSLRGSVAPDVGGLRASDGSPLFDEWGTLLYAEADGEIRWGGILTSSTFEGSQWSIEAAGFTTYPHGTPYLGTYSKTSVDPLDALREIWRHVQSFKDGGLGMVIPSTKTPVRLGSNDEPYTLDWWDAKDCGDEIDTLAKETPFDFAEQHSWASDGTIAHKLLIGYPRLGTKRRDLAFVMGDNVTNVVTVQRDGSQYASAVLGLGAGEGSKSLRRSTSVTLPNRLRRVSVYSDKSITSSSRMDSLIRDELQTRRNLLDIAQVDVIDHPNAPLGAWQLGDDVLVQADVPWLGEVRLWCRITGWSLTSDTRASLTVQRSDKFTYGGSTQ